MTWLRRLLNRPEDPQTLRRCLLEFVQASAPAGCRQILRAHPELLSDEAFRVLEQLGETRNLMSAEARRRFDERRELLQQCRRRGVAAALASYGRQTAEDAGRPNERAAAGRIELPDWWHEDAPVLDAGPGDGRHEAGRAPVADLGAGAAAAGDAPPAAEGREQ
ncbi:MAG TPA: hypothetical protein PLB78_18690, partial [Anaerolineae bacterium]|nr:hypothetical protein [Anaerolineae bacterium]